MIMIKHKTRVKVSILTAGRLFVSVKCAALSDISNGNITFQTDQVSTSASYTCGVGYTLSDDVIRSCLDDGSWTQNDPTCGMHALCFFYHVFLFCC